ncbi:hypothetical protein BH748_03215 [Enterococcus casseliflavus]|uniref:hypothetical protein n=1 Tax=Enterococcus casseliflavus TaxID=37734 RepID=UPI0009BF2B4C|nr:hypothetical protein [Enterococcus casseliflavus]OQO87173.1 hypothetical protein BH748_03215 [Enterococcus casseliflavus]
MELDQFRDVDLVIDRANDSFVQKQFVSQGDYKGRTLTVQVTNNGNVGEVPGLTLNLNWHNEASGLTDLTAFSVVNKAASVFTIEYPEHMMTPGKVYASIQVIQNGKVTNLKQFELTVQRLAGQPVGIVEKAEYSALVAVLADSNQFRTDIDTLGAVKVDKEDLQSVVTDLKNEISQVPNGAPSGSFASLSELTAAFPSGNANIYVINDQWYFWSGTNWAVGGSYGGGTPSENSVGASALRDFSVAQKKMSDLSVTSRAITNESVSFKQTNNHLQERIKTYDKKYSKQIAIAADTPVSKDTLAKIKVVTPTRNSVGTLTINGRTYDQLSDDIVEDDAIKTKFKKWSFLDALGDIDAISWFTTYTDAIRIRSSKVVFANDILVNRNNVFPVGTVPNWSFVQQSEYDGQQNVDYIASHTGVYGLSVNITRSTLTAAGKSFSLQGVKEYLKTLVDFEIYCKTATENFVPAFYRPCLTTFLLNAGEKISYDVPSGSVVTLSGYEEPIIINYAEDMRPIATYMTTIENNISKDRESETVKLKVKFEDGECLNEECLDVYVDNINTPFEFLKNFGDQPISNEEMAVYPSGFLRYGYIVLTTDVAETAKVVKVNVYNQPVNHDFPERVSISFDSDTNFVLSANGTSVRLNGTQGFAINDLAVNGLSVATTHLQQTILTDAANTDIVLKNQAQPAIVHLGNGYAFRGVIADYDTQISGVKVRIKLFVYPNGKVESERVVMFENYSAGFKNIKFKGYFYQPGFEKTSDLSIGGTFANQNFAYTNHDIQYIENGGADGFVSQKVLSVSSGFGTGGYTASISVDNISSKIPSSGDYYSSREIFKFGSASVQDLEVISMNPISATLSKKFKREAKKELKERLANFIDNTADGIENWRLRVGRLAVLMAYHEINGSVDKHMDDLLDLWTEAVGTFSNAEKMWNLYVDGLGIEYQGRNQQMLPDVIAFFARHGLTEQKLQAETMLNDFCQFYVRVETYSGANGSVYLGYGTDRDNLNAEAAVLNGWYYKKQYTGSLSAAEQSACERVESKFLRSIRFENVLPYIEGDNLLHQFKLHYALFSTYAYAEHASDIPYDITAHAEAALTPNGKIYEMAYDWQATRRGQPHTSLYAIYLFVLQNNISSIQEALNVFDNLQINSFPTGGIRVPMDEWVTHEESSTLNTLISLMIATKIYDYIV